MTTNVFTTFFKSIFLNENCCFAIHISLKCIPQGPTDNKSALVQIMASHRTGDKPLTKPMTAYLSDSYIVSLSHNKLTHWVRYKITVISQTIFWNAFSGMKMYDFRLRFHWNLFFKVRINNIPALVQIMAPIMAPTRQQAIIWINDNWVTDAYMRHWASMSQLPQTRLTTVYDSIRHW